MLIDSNKLYPVLRKRRWETSDTDQIDHNPKRVDSQVENRDPNCFYEEQLKTNAFKDKTERRLAVGRHNKLMAVKKKAPLWFDSLEEMEQAIDDLKHLPRSDLFLKRIIYLKSLFKSETSEMVDEVFWVTFKTHAISEKKVFLKVKFCEDKYHSHGIKETELIRSPKHYYLYVSETVGDPTDSDTEILRARFGKANGELCWVSKGLHISGNEVLSLAMLFKNYINIPLYLYDDAMKAVPGQDDILLKTLAIGDPNGKTWYQKQIPTLQVARGTWTLTCGKSVEQDKYQEALTVIREIRICDIWTFFRKDGEKNNFIKLVKSVYKDEFEESQVKIGEKFMPLCTKTIRELAEDTLALVRRLNDAQTLSLQSILHTTVIEAPDESQLARFYRKFDVTSELETAQRYWKHIRTISDSRIFIWPQALC